MRSVSSKLPRPRTFDCLVSIGRMSREEMDAALAEAVKGPQDLEAILLEKYRVPKADLGLALSGYFNCPFIEYSHRTFPDPKLLKNLNVDYLKKNHWIPMRRENNVLDILIDNPQDLEKGLDIKRAFPGLTLRFAVGLCCDIEAFLIMATNPQETESADKLLGELIREADSEQWQGASDENVDENDSTIVRLTHQIIADAYRMGASDIHIEPNTRGKEMAVRIRVDGTCATYMKIPAAYRRAIVSRLKIMANLDIAERRKPQDGKIRFKVDKDNEIELRVATLPTSDNNEDVVMRILTAKLHMSLEEMGLAERTVEAIKRMADHPYGLILCVGPTGSGKTTTLHAILAYLNTDSRKIWTAEDPIEITQDGLRQLQVHPKIGLTFETALRSFLRADPDVIMIGEMRDKETAEVALEASLTGHLVLSTLHTNSAVETVVRLLDMGCDPFNFADALLGVMAKRLCKRICPECKEAYHPTREEFDELVHSYGEESWKRLSIQYDGSFKLYRGKGCAECNYTGFRGRVGLHELLVGSDDVRGAIHTRAKTHELLSLAMMEGMTTLFQDGVLKVLQGHTTLKQVRTVAMR